MFYLFWHAASFCRTLFGVFFCRVCGRMRTLFIYSNQVVTNSYHTTALLTNVIPGMVYVRGWLW